MKPKASNLAANTVPPTPPALASVTCYATDRWGKFPTFLAKVGSGCSHLILVKRAPRDRKFHVGQPLQYCVEETLAGMSTSCTPKWKRGSIWKIENDVLYVA